MHEPPPPVAGIRFRNAGKIFYFHTAGMRLETGEYVVVETVRGPELGRVVIAPGQVLVNELNMDELKPILRLATSADITRMDALRQRAEDLLPEARAIAEDARFPARIDAAELTLDGRRLTFSFTSEDRLDYRDFLRRVGDRFGAKVDMRQLGARDRAKLAGGYGICGRELCCSNWLTTFPSISIRMAKEQDLPLNPQKISGLCGRLLCCLSYEEEGYKEMRRSLPKLGQRCSTPTGEGKVIGLNILQRSVTLIVEGQRIEVGDRDLGTVVRWDTGSKIGDPPPSIPRADAIAQGLIEADERDLAGDDGFEEPFREPGGRGRLPGGGPRKEIRSKPAPAAASTPPAQGRGGPGEPPAAPGGPDQRRRRGDGRERPAVPQAPPGGQQRRQPRGGPPDATPALPPERRRGQPQGDGAPREPRGQRPAGIPGAQARVFKRGGAPTDGSEPPAGEPHAPRPPQPPRPPRAEGDQPAPGTGEPRRAPRRRGRGGGGPPPPAE